ncbi:GD17777 [Drosophila simulans]|uniref:GD17777 n=1 Tax=Drosophila simulans TaxID=7240 RepID=B4QYY3_DROSI|nr:GD17777 [Drosophila simulans]
MTPMICGKTSQAVRSHRNYLYKAFSTLVEREKLSPVEQLFRNFIELLIDPQYIEETKLKKSDRHFTCSEWPERHFPSN